MKKACIKVFMIKNIPKISGEPCDSIFTFDDRIDEARERKYFRLMMQYFSEIKCGTERDFWLS